MPDISTSGPWSTCTPTFASRTQTWKKAYIALGANVGDKVGNLERACDMLRSHPLVRLLRTSLLYPTAPMYVADQEMFYNAACEIETALDPFDLLDFLQEIEHNLGRVKKIEKGPRSIDLDILLYEGVIIDSQRLTIPHKLMHEREFVLRPLADMCPDQVIPTPHSCRAVRCFLSDLQPSNPPMTPIVPFAPTINLRPLEHDRDTKVMSILNVTPDSFSDGGFHYTTNLADSFPIEPLDRPYLRHLHSTISTHMRCGASIIDIGGQSTRPNAPSITAEEEFARIRPSLALAAALRPPAISIDTYRASVFRAATQLVPHTPLILNDISAGLFDPDILRVAAETHSTVILMHTRGTPDTMYKRPHIDYPEGLVRTIARELRARVAAAEAAGIPRWRIVLDPGIGFAKTAKQNLELLRDFAQLRDAEGLRGLPWLVGSSRKGFIGKLLGRSDEALRGAKGSRSVAEREWGTAATVAAAVQGGADIVRVHDVREMRDVVAVADGIWRNGLGDPE
ncbi:hypothetical protein ANO11243_063060 [Dothideomycetidae sp. 11243]|nr:hypothetical protein ANO11243_063060 [fungal sp. No.11243]